MKICKSRVGVVAAAAALLAAAPGSARVTTGTWVWSIPFPVPAGQSTGGIYHAAFASQ